jgi:hypothetical protein
MEASERPTISFSRVESRGLFGLLVDESAVRELIANDDRSTGFTRLGLMINDVLENLIATDGPAGDDGEPGVGT